MQPAGQMYTLRMQRTAMQPASISVVLINPCQFWSPESRCSMIRAKIDLFRLGLTCSGGQKAFLILVFTSAALSSMKMALLGSLFDIFS